MVAVRVVPPVYAFFFEPAAIVRSFEEVEREADEKQHSKRRRRKPSPAAGARPRRRQGRGLPPPYPNAWFRVCNSGDVAVRTCVSGVMLCLLECGRASRDEYERHLFDWHRCEKDARWIPNHRLNLTHVCAVDWGCDGSER